MAESILGISARLHGGTRLFSVGDLDTRAWAFRDDTKFVQLPAASDFLQYAHFRSRRSVYSIDEVLEVVRSDRWIPIQLFGLVHRSHIRGADDPTFGGIKMPKVATVADHVMIDRLPRGNVGGNYFIFMFRPPTFFPLTDFEDIF